MEARFELRTVQDENAEAPNEWGDDAVFLVTKNHRYFSVEAPEGWSLGRVCEMSKGDMKNFVAFPLYAYIHSGVALSLGQEYPFNDQWDSCRIGYVVVKKAGFGTECDLREVAAGFVTTWNQYLSGDVWGYQIVRIDTCDLGHTHEEVVESCYGFYGHEYCLSEGKIALDYFLDSPTSEAFSGRRVHE